MNKVKPHQVLDSVTLRIMKTLIENPERNYTRNKLADAAGLDPDSIYLRWDTLSGLEIVEEAPVQSVHDYYTLNRDSKATKLLEELMYDVIEVDVE